MGSRPSSPHIANMKYHSFFDLSLPLEEDVRVSQPLKFPPLSCIATSSSNPIISIILDPPNMIYHYDIAYENPPSSHMASSFVDPPHYTQPNSPNMILQHMRAKRYITPSSLLIMPPIYGHTR